MKQIAVDPRISKTDTQTDTDIRDSRVAETEGQIDIHIYIIVYEKYAQTDGQLYR